MMWLLNRLLNGLFDLIIWPCMVDSPWPGLILTSLITAIVLVALFRVSSNQSAIREARNRFLARALELLLFQHDLRVSLTACKRILAANAEYLIQFLIPMTLGLVPIILFFIQLECWFDRRPLKIGESAVLSVKLDSARSTVTVDVTLKVSENFRIDSPAVRIPSTNELAWRIVATAPGSGWADVKVAGDTERKSLATGVDLSRVSTERVSSGLLRELFSPSEPPLSENSPVRQMQVYYPSREISVGLTEIPWAVAVLALVIVFSLVLSKLSGVRIA